MHPRKQEFISLLKSSGWSQAEAARRLDLTRGGLNGIVTGPTKPSSTLLKLFRLLLQIDGAGGTKPQENPPASGVSELQAELQRLDEQVAAVKRAAAKLVPKVSSIETARDQIADAVTEGAQELAKPK